MPRKRSASPDATLHHLRSGPSPSLGEQLQTLLADGAYPPVQVVSVPLPEAPLPLGVTEPPVGVRAIVGSAPEPPEPTFRELVETHHSPAPLLAATVSDFARIDSVVSSQWDVIQIAWNPVNHAIEISNGVELIAFRMDNHDRYHDVAITLAYSLWDALTAIPPEVEL